MNEDDAGGSNDDVELLLQDGARAYDSGDLGVAMGKFKQAIELNSNHESSYLWLGAVHRAVGRLEECLDDCDNALRVYPDCAQTLDYKATCLIDLARFQEALETAQYALSLEDDDVDAYDLQGIALRWLGRPEEARISFDKALEVDPSAEYVHIHKCTTLHDLGRTNEALRILTSLTKAGPCHVLCLTSRAIILRDLGQIAQADVLFDAARNSSKIAFRQFALAFGQRLYHSRQYREALFYFNKYLHPDLIDACAIQEASINYYSGMTLSMMRARGREAITRFERAMQLDGSLELKCRIGIENVARYLHGEKIQSCISFYDILLHTLT